MKLLAYCIFLLIPGVFLADTKSSAGKTAPKATAAKATAPKATTPKATTPKTQTTMPTTKATTPTVQAAKPPTAPTPAAQAPPAPRTTATEESPVKGAEGAEQRSSSSVATIALYVGMSLIILSISAITCYVIMRRRAQATLAVGGGGTTTSENLSMNTASPQSREVYEIEEKNRLKNLRKQKKSVEEIMMTQIDKKHKRTTKH